MSETENPRSAEKIREEVRIVGDKINAFILRQLELIQDKSERAESGRELAALTGAAAELIHCINGDWLYFAFPPGTNRVPTSKGLRIRRESSQE